MSEIARTIDAVLAGSLVPALQAAGYRKSGRTWRRTGPSSVRVVNVQGSSWNSGDSGQFTINLGLYFPALAPLVGWGHTTENPTEPACQIRRRIGRLLPGGRDHWWTVTPTTDVELLALDVRAAWDNHAARWFDMHDGLEAARALAAEQYPYGAAAVSLALGDRPDAQRLIDEALAASSQRSRGEAIRSWARQNGFAVAAA
jgi:hypothetical protein